VSENGLHVVFGAGQVGRVLSARLAAAGLAVRLLSRNRPDAVPAGVEWLAVDASDAERAVDAADGGQVIYQCLGAPYTQWPQLFPALQRGVLRAAERNDALLVSLENLYGYGPTGGRPLTEDLPLTAKTVKGRTRAAMTEELLAASSAGRVRIAIGRASDFFGPGVTETTLGERVFAKALADKRVDFIGNPDLPHTYSYVPDVATGLATLGTDDRAVGGIWHLPGPETVTTRAVLDLLASEVAHPVGIRSVPKPLLRLLAVFNPLMRELAEIAYQAEEPFVLDTTKYQSVFGDSATPLPTAIAATVAWYRDPASPPQAQEGSDSWLTQPPDTPAPLRISPASVPPPASEHL
jgi:nucleoside-diphosphate-sugar epimerase